MRQHINLDLVYSMKITFVLAFVLISGIQATEAASATLDKPNLLLIYCDDLGWGDVSFNGHPIVKTPNIDALSEGPMLRMKGDKSTKSVAGNQTPSNPPSPALGQGTMSGEVTSSSALVQTRLTLGTQLDERGDLPGADGVVCFEWSDNHTSLSGFRHEADAFFACGALNDENSRMGVLPGAKNGTDPDGKVRQPFISPQPSGGFVQVQAGKTLDVVFYDDNGRALYDFQYPDLTIDQ